MFAFLSSVLKQAHTSLGVALFLWTSFSAVFASPPPGFYNRTFGLSGEALEMTLNEIVRDHTVVPYTWAFQFDAWNALQDLDRDPAQPANVLLVFSGQSVPGSDINGGNNPNITDQSWEREHLWPRSYGLGQDGADFSDLFNLRPINQAVNQARSNRTFRVPLLQHPTDPAEAAPGAPLCLWDPRGHQGRLWAPRPVERGDLARVKFYMAVRYDGRDPETINLTLGDEPDQNIGRFSHLSSLLDWHEADPVDAEERRRNNLIFTEYQGNRNPFVDRPDLVRRVFGQAPPPREATLHLSRDVVAVNAGPGAVTGVVTLSEPAAGPVTVNLSASGSHPGFILPPSVTIGTGERTAVFAIDATAASVPPFQSFRQTWTVQAEVPTYGVSDAGLIVLGGGGGGWETFDRLLLYGSGYRDGEYVGDHGVSWSYVHATGQQSFPIQGRGILLRNVESGSALRSGPIAGGVGRLAIDLRKAFSGTGARQVEVLINGVSRGFSPEFGNFSGSSAAVLTYTLDHLNVDGDFTLEIRNARGGQLVVDNVRWTRYAPGAGPSTVRAETIPNRLRAPLAREAEATPDATLFRLLATGISGTLPVSVSAPAGFEISLDGQAFASQAQVPVLSGGAIDRFLYLRLKEMLEAGDYAGVLLVQGNGIALSVSVSGVVEPGEGALAPAISRGGSAQNFSQFLGANQLPEGWRVEADGTSTGRYTFSLWGNTTTGIKHGSASDAVLGYQHTADTGNVRLVTNLVNRTGQTIRALDISYRGRRARISEGRTPAFTVRLNGAVVPGLAYSTTEADGLERRVRLGHLNIPAGSMVEIEWRSTRGGGSGSSRQIGISDFQIRLPEPPHLELTGPGEIWVKQGDSFFDPGASAVDPVEGSVSVMVSGNVNTSTPGVYTLTYRAENSLGLAAPPVTRQVIVLAPLDFFLQRNHGLAAELAEPLAAPAEDGISNLLKFALGGEPLVTDRTILPSPKALAEGIGLRFRLGAEVQWNESGGFLHGSGLVILLERSVDLTGWQPTRARLASPEAANGSFQPGTEVILRPETSAGGGREFLRLRVVLDDGS